MNEANEAVLTAGGAVNGSSASVAQRYKFWRWAIFGITWLTYVGFYLCRKNFPVAQPALMEQFGWAKDQVYVISMAYLISYSIAQMTNGVIGDRVGAKLMLGIGLTLTIIANFLFGLGHSIAFFTVILALNGIAQGSGWCMCIKTIANWFSVKERGVVTGWWVSCYTVGDVVAISLAGALIGVHGWRSTFVVPAVIVIAILALFLLIHRNKPQDASLPSITCLHEHEAGTKEDAGDEAVPILTNLKEVLSKWTIWVLAGTYFGLKLVRYTFLFWINVFMVEKLGYRIDKAAFATILIPACGFVGTVFAGYASDKIFNARRAPIIVLMMLGLAVSIVGYYYASHNAVWSMVFLALIGFMTYGPDAVVSGPAAMDFGSRRSAGLAAGFINGFGSVGSILSSIVGGIISTKFGWGAAFYFLAAVILVFSGLMVVMWNKVGSD